MTGNTLEQRARELLAAEYEKQGRSQPDIGTPLFDIHIAALRAIEAALRLSAGADWQPIETAPTDKMILGWNKWETAVYKAETMVIRGGPIAVWRVPGDHDDVYDSPTLWMPLPAAPRHEPGEGDRG